MAQAPEVIVKPGADENLNKIMEVLEGVAARTEELSKKNAEFDNMAKKVEDLQSRAEVLDKRLSRGSRTWSESDEPTRNQSFREFGKIFSAAWRFRQYNTLEDGYERAGGGAGQKTDQVTQGGVLVPVVTYDQIARIIGESSIIRRIATTVPMTTNTITMPTKTSGPTVTWIGTEGSIATKTSVILDNPQLVSKTLMALDEITSELEEDSIVALEPFFAAVFAEAVAQEENSQAFSATTPFTGVVQTSSVGNKSFTTGGAAFSLVKYADLLNLQFGVDSKLHHKGVFIMHSAMFKEICGLTDSNGRPIFATSWTSLPSVMSPPDQYGAVSTTLLGRPCYLTDTMPSSGYRTAAAIYGDFSKFIFGDRKQMSIDFSDQVYFEYGNMALRVRERIAMKVLIASAFARLMTTAS
jgi:HK97 family phage major capsid protein